MAASPVSVVARSPKAHEIIRPPARPGAFLQTLQTLAGQVPRPLHPKIAGQSPGESKKTIDGEARRMAPEPDPAAKPEPADRSAESCHERDVVGAGPDARDDRPWDPLDPSCRALAALMPIERATPVSVDRCDRVRSTSLEQLFGALVKRVAWSTTPDRSSATLRLEIGAGELAGATVLITADLHELRVVLDTPPGIDLEAWKNRLSQRLASKGLAATFP